jgi:hypothetical protein
LQIAAQNTQAYIALEAEFALVAATLLAVAGLQGFLTGFRPFGA